MEFNLVDGLRVGWEMFGIAIIVDTDDAENAVFTARS